MDSSLNADRIAVLIDADNTSHRYAEALLDEIAKYGNPTIKRAYGDWTSPRLGGWTQELNARAIRGMHQGAFTTGKNATDSALIIDAMDLLYSGNVEAFALVTSDSDFTSLALRLRESGKTVYGLGGKRTPASLQNACDKFIRLEVLGEDASDEEGDEEADESIPEPRLNLQSAMTKAVNATSDEDGWTTLGAIGNHLRRTHAAFDPRMFGHSKLTDLVAEQGYLETTGQGNETRIRLKGKQPARRSQGTKAPAEKAQGDKGQGDKGQGDKGQAAKAPAEKGQADKGPAAKAPDTPAPARKRAQKQTAAPEPQPEEQQAPEQQAPEKPVVVKRTRSRKSTTIPASNG